MSDLKTKKTTASVESFLSTIADSQRQQDCREISKLMQQATKSRPAMWGSSIVGFGDYTYKYPNGREMAWFQLGFSPRAQNLALYMRGTKRQSALLKKLGTHKLGGGCLYVKRLEDVDTRVLKQLIETAISSQ